MQIKKWYELVRGLKDMKQTCIKQVCAVFGNAMLLIVAEYVES
jgi:hypothetical protein